MATRAKQTKQTRKAEAPSLADQATLRMDPVGFAKGALGHDVWGLPAQILRSVAKNRRTAVKSCHSSAKTFTAAEITLWWITHYPDGIAITTAPTWIQVKKLLWGEIRKSLIASKVKYPKPMGSDFTELKLSEGNYALGLSTNEGVRFQGFHAAHILFVLDEAPGVDTAIWEAIEGAAAGGHVSILAIGNPIIASGPFHAAFHENRDNWKTFTISAFDTPNLQGLKITHGTTTLGDPNGRDLLTLSEEELDRNPLPYLTTRRWVKEKFFEWGPGHPLWDSKVIGEFPEQSEDALLSLRWLEAARLAELPAEGKARFGLDVAGPGEDETVLVGRRSSRVILSKAWGQADPRGDVIAELMPFFKAGELESVNVDSIGIGWGMYLHLRDIFGSEIVHAVNVGEAPQDAERFANLKAEVYWGLRLRFQQGDVAGLTDERTQGQLSGIRYKHNPRGQIIIESKDDARKRGVRSPDRAEAWMLCFAKREITLGLLDYVASQEAHAIERASDPAMAREEDEQKRAEQRAELKRLADEDRMKVSKLTQAGTLMKPVTTPADGKNPTPTCGKCGSTAPLTRIPGGRRCPNCGEQVQDKGVGVLPLMPSRGDLLK